MTMQTSSRHYRPLLRAAVLLALLPTAWAGDGIASQSTLTEAGARKVAATALEYARTHNAPGGAIAIVDGGGTLIYFERLEGTFRNASDIAIGKARTAALFGKPTRVFEKTVNEGRYTMLAVPAVAPFTPLKGGVPIEVRGQVVGAIGISGAASADQDDEIASAAAAEFARAEAATAAN